MSPRRSRPTGPGRRREMETPPAEPRAGRPGGARSSEYPRRIGRQTGRSHYILWLEDPMLDKMGSNFKDYAPFILRVGLATVFIIQGARDVTNHGSVESLVIGGIELLGGLFALIGFLTRLAAGALLALMAWEIFHRHGLRAF